MVSIAVTNQSDREIAMSVETSQAGPSFAEAADEPRIERALAGLRNRGFVARAVDTPADARRTVNELLPPDKDIFTASSQTLSISGILEDIEDSGTYRSLRRKAAELEGADFWELVKLGAAPDVVVGSVHAVTEDGVVVAASFSGSQLAPYAATAAKVIWVVGSQKIVPDLDTAFRRVREHCLPLEDERVREEHGQQSLIGKMLVVEREVMPDRVTVVVVRTPIGF